VGVSSLPRTVTRQRRDCDLNPGPSARESSTSLTTRLPSRPSFVVLRLIYPFSEYSDDGVWRQYGVLVTIVTGCVALDTQESSVRVQVAQCPRQLPSRQGSSQPVPSVSTYQVPRGWHEQGRSVLRPVNIHKKALYVLYNAFSPCRQVVHTQYGCPAKYRGENAGPLIFEPYSVEHHHQ